MHLSEKLKKYINGPHGMNMGTRDAALKPEYHRVLGTKVLDDRHVQVFIDGKSAGRTFDNLNDNQQMTVVYCSLENFESYQLKGRSVSWQASNNEELEIIEEYFLELNKGVVAMGLPDDIIRNYPHTSMVTLLMEVEEVYEQTPKIGTGKKVVM